MTVLFPKTPEADIERSNDLSSQTAVPSQDQEADLRPHDPYELLAQNDALGSAPALTGPNGPFSHFNGTLLVVSASRTILSGNSMTSPLVDLVHNQGSAELMGAIEKALNGKAARFSPFRVLHKNGVSIFDLSILPWSNGSAVLLLGRDITFERAQVQALRQELQQSRVLLRFHETITEACCTHKACPRETALQQLKALCQLDGCHLYDLSTATAKPAAGSGEILSAQELAGIKRALPGNDRPEPLEVRLKEKHVLAHKLDETRLLVLHGTSPLSAHCAALAQSARRFLKQ